MKEFETLPVAASIPVVSMEAVFWDKEKGLYRSPVITIAISSYQKGDDIVSCGQPLVGLGGGLKQVSRYINFIGYEYDGRKRNWESRIETVRKKIMRKEFTPANKGNNSSYEEKKVLGKTRPQWQEKIIDLGKRQKKK